ncbi:MAG: carbohydrate-binding family 9-like protein [Phaeodactylibacter sp.]|uniref:carbohydrate-binding family 9-like protein n=1 Tax=Phaeodactylibacter sp. TaxID=1940289 RepID=UPI0032EDE60F
MMRSLYVIVAVLALHTGLKAQQHDLYTFNPRQYVCQYVDTPLEIDGKLEEKAWKQAPSTDKFIDIEGTIKPLPYYDTQVKMLWDSQYFYIAVELEEPHLWATYDQRDMVIFHENDFEVFIDPDGDTHHYYELEINALGTIWDLILTRPYRDGGQPIDAWDIRGLQSGVHLNGTLNNPDDEDKSWTVELALPWSVLEELAPHPGPPNDQEIWRVNFSRVQWQTEANGKGYQKKTDPATGAPYPEHNWVWSPQGAIAMHQPETWGLVQFSNTPPGKRIRFNGQPNLEAIRWQLRQLYYKQNDWHETHGAYTDDPSQLGLAGEPITVIAGADYFIALYELGDLKVRIREDGKIDQIHPTEAQE